MRSAASSVNTANPSSSRNVALLAQRGTLPLLLWIVLGAGANRGFSNCAGGVRYWENLKIASINSSYTLGSARRMACVAHFSK